MDTFRHVFWLTTPVVAKAEVALPPPLPKTADNHRVHAEARVHSFSLMDDQLTGPGDAGVLLLDASIIGSGLIQSSS